jgi:hypothetical protein
MGGRGIDGARSRRWYLDDDFGSIVQAVRMGRSIFDNLKKAIVTSSPHPDCRMSPWSCSVAARAARPFVFLELSDPPALS